MEVYAVFICTRYIFKRMNCGLVMLRMWIIDIGGKKCEGRCNVRASVGNNPIDAANNTLIDFFLTRKIRI